MTALISVPVAAALIGGFGSEMSDYIVAGVTTVAPMAGMFVFAILFFGVMSDAGLFKPFVRLVLRVVGRSPPRIVVGTVVLATLVHLDGSGASTFLISVPALLPLYDELRMDRRVLACAVAMAAGVNNMLPWGGPTIRAATALNENVMAIYGPLASVHAVGLCFVLFCALVLGHREKRRLLADGNDPAEGELPRSAWDPVEVPVDSPARLALNFGVTVAVVGAMVTSLLHPMVAFMIGAVAALAINFPGAKPQRERIDAHSSTALMMAAVLLAAGAFAGIMQGSGMLAAMAEAGAGLVPEDGAAYLPVIMAVLSMPLSLLFDPDSFYFGVLPVVAEVGNASGTDGIRIAQGALLGQMTTGFPVSPLTPATFLLIGLARVDLSDHQRFSIPFLFATSLAMTAAGLLFGVLMP